MSTNKAWPLQVNNSVATMLLRVSLHCAQALATAIALGTMAPLFPMILFMHVWVWLHNWLTK